MKSVAIPGKFTMSEVQYKVGHDTKANEDFIIGEESRTFIEDKEPNALRDNTLEEFLATSESTSSLSATTSC